MSLKGNSSRIPDGKPPRFPKKPTIKQEGDFLLMECVLEAQPLPEITWFQGSRALKAGDRLQMKQKETGKDTYLLTLVISNPSLADGGNYRCNAVNAFGESNANIALNFQGGDDGGIAPTFIEKPKITPNSSGTLITMRCRCKANPEPQVTWFRGATQLSASGRLTMKSVKVDEDVYDLILEIKEPSGADAGTYRCHVENSSGESNANLNLNIEAEPEPAGQAPTFAEKPRIISEQNGKLIFMECKVKADPKPTFVWTCEGQEIKTSSKFSISMKEEGGIYVIRLDLKDPQPEESGLYKCNIKNEFGEINANLTLNIEIAPQIREKPRVIRVQKKRTIVIECSVRCAAPPEVTWYNRRPLSRRTAGGQSILNKYRRESTRSCWKSAMPPKRTKARTSSWPRTRRVNLLLRVSKSLRSRRRKRSPSRNQKARLPNLLKDSSPPLWKKARVLNSSLNCPAWIRLPT